MSKIVKNSSRRLLSNQQAKPPKLLIYLHKCQRKAINPNIKAGNSHCLTFLLEESLKRLLK